ncbi:hypothetical protein WMY93_011519 [Mugilogobius chulae]|uniref:Uncharacterized protein n=1 Tax=Mugilogobius chulae TaxID=88201 RepID=A0AAW0PEW3_9GOBI
MSIIKTNVCRRYTEYHSFGFENFEGNDAVDNKANIKRLDYEQEKKDLEVLNRRLSAYIAEVRILEEEKTTLEKELQQLKKTATRVNFIFKAEKEELEKEIQEDKSSILLQQTNALKEKLNTIKTEETNSERLLENEKKELLELTKTYAVAETRLVSQVRELKFYDELLQEMWRGSGRELYENQINVYQKETKEFRQKTEAIDIEIEILKKIIQRMKDDKKQIMPAADALQVYEEHVTEKTTKVVQKIASISKFDNQKDELDGKIREYREEGSGILNRRLSAYIAEVRILEEEKTTLEKELQQLKKTATRVNFIFKAEKEELEKEIQEDKSSIILQQTNALKEKLNTIKTEETNSERLLENEKKELLELTKTYAVAETKLVSQVRELRFYDELLQEMWRGSGRELYENQINVYQKETKEFRQKTEAIDIEIEILKKIIQRMKDDKKQIMPAADALQVYEKHVSEKTTKVVEKITSISKTNNQMDEVDGKIREYRYLLMKGEMYMPSQEEFLVSIPKIKA